MQVYGDAVVMRPAKGCTVCLNVVCRIAKGREDGAGWDKSLEYACEKHAERFLLER